MRSRSSYRSERRNSARGSIWVCPLETKASHPGRRWIVTLADGREAGVWAMSKGDALKDEQFDGVEVKGVRRARRSDKC
jgi:hypothetical protein